MSALLDATFAIATGATIPALGFGTWQIPEGAPAYDQPLVGRGAEVLGHPQEFV